ncbi:MAG: signal peptidase II [Actinobacteria bacterium]|nr:signal peptidase II [Actinomycetota bacterium]MCL5070279.1 signal peptidase II [Actinomycetota bacterium]
MQIKASKKLLNIIFAANAAVILILDQLTKYIINRLPQSVFPIEAIPKFLYIIRITNTGAAFGLFQNRTKIFIIISIIAIILIIVLKIKMDLKIVLYNIGLGFVLGGALGNLVDRLLFKGQVTDFIHVVYFAVFNVADSFIVIGFGIIILVILKFFFKKGAA